MTATDVDVDAFLRAIVAAPGDSLPRLIFADWLEEHDRHAEAAGQRWAAKHGKYPLHHGWTHPQNGGSFAGGWHMFNTVLPPHCILDSHFAGIRGSSQLEPMLCETLFLERCAELTWGEDGEPS